MELSTPPLFGLYLIASLLLVVAGARKAVDPDDTARAVAALLPRRFARFGAVRVGVRGGALAELALGLAALAAPRPLTAALVAASYLGFAAVVALARHRGGPLASCGCLGQPDTPATRLHLFTNLALGVAALTVAMTVPHSGWLATQLARQPGRGTPLLAVSLVGLLLTYLALSSAASLDAARRLAGIGRSPS